MKLNLKSIMTAEKLLKNPFRSLIFPLKNFGCCFGSAGTKNKTYLIPYLFIK